MNKVNGTNKQRRFWLPTSEKFGSEGSSPSLIHPYIADGNLDELEECE